MRMSHIGFQQPTSIESSSLGRVDFLFNLPSMGKDTALFDFDEEEYRFSSGAGEHGSGEEDIQASGCSKRDSIDLFRRAMPEVEVEEDVCSICLDAFTEDDPGNTTTCEHTFHLQCIMQWAQRSRECPLCFKTLALQDPDLQELLPFGEYVPPEHSGPASSAVLGIEPWDMDRLLQRLALQTNSTGRRSRARNGIRPYSMPGPRIETTRYGQNGAMDASTSSRDREHVQLVSSQVAEGDYPSSWPPSGTSIQQERNTGPEEVHRLKSGGQVDLRSAGESLKSRWSSFQNRCRESLSRSTSGFKSKSDRNPPTSPQHVQPQKQ